MTAPASPPLLCLEGVTKDYGTRIVTHVLRGIDLLVAPGEFVELAGASGSRQSTLMNLIGLLDRPTAGRIVFQGADVSTLDEATTTGLRGRALGFVFQFHYLLPAFTAAENVMLPLLADRGRRDRDMAERAAALLADVGLSGRADYRATDLSGGEQQRAVDRATRQL
jgi:lipoprotein-releasing system ATP-binding protein